MMYVSHPTMRRSYGHSKTARAGLRLTVGLFAAPREDRAMRHLDDPQSAIRAALRRRRRTLGLTQEAAARMLGLPRFVYHRIETGRRRIRLDELAAICAAYGCHVGEIVQDGELAAGFAHAARALLGRMPG
jgi:DNA-binding XRE family transcriptional regulator